MATAVGDAPQLLVVLVDERARVVVDVADRDATQAVGVAQPAVAGPGQDGVHGRARDARVRGPIRCGPQRRSTRAAGSPRPLGRGQPRRVVRPGGAVLEPGPALGSIPGHPLVGRRPADAWASAALATDQPSTSTRVTRSCRPKTLRRAVR